MSNIHALTQQEAATLLSVTARSLRDWENAAEGVPRNTDGTYPGPALFAWYLARQAGDALDALKERARKDREHADKLALENAETRGDVARISVMEEEVGSLLSDHRTNMLGFPSKAAPLLVGLNADQIRDRLESGVHELLGDLADYRPGARKKRSPSGIASGGNGREAAAEADGERVG